MINVSNNFKNIHKNELLKKSFSINSLISKTYLTPISLVSVACLFLSACASQPTHRSQSRPVFVNGVPNYYIVRNGDTLSRITTRYGLDYRRVGALNGLDSNYTIYPGQRLILTSAKRSTNRPAPYRPTPSQPITVNQGPISTTNRFPIISQPISQPPVTASVPSVPVVPTANTLSQNWLRPTSGNLVRPFNQANGVLGMWFGGQQGAPVVASQPGTVLYVGSDLPEYGKLVMIQHNSDYISAYAHLDQINVQERQVVQAGDRIGTLGFVDSLNQPAVEFQIRYRGTPTNPANFIK